MSSIVENDTGKTPFKRLIVNNAQGRKVQCTAWREHKDVFNEIDQLNMVVHLMFMQAVTPKNPQWNSGNINLELIAKGAASVEIFGLYQNPNDTDLQTHEISIADSKPHWRSHW